MLGLIIYGAGVIGGLFAVNEERKKPFNKCKTLKGAAPELAAVLLWPALIPIIGCFAIRIGIDEFNVKIVENSHTEGDSSSSQSTKG